MHVQVEVTTTMNARESNRDVGLAKRRAKEGPVIITDRGEPAYVLPTIEEHRKRNGSGESLVGRLSTEDGLNFEFRPVQVGLRVPEL